MLKKLNLGRTTRANLKPFGGTTIAGAAEAGSTLGVGVHIRNSGAIAARVSTTEFVLSTNGTRDAADTRLSTQSTKPLKKRASVHLKPTLSIPSSAAGTYYVLACADSGKKVKESNERDNCMTLGSALSITAPATDDDDDDDDSRDPATSTPPVAPTTPTTPAPAQIFSFSHNTIDLGSLPVSASEQEVNATKTIVTVTNVSNAPSPDFEIVPRRTSHPSDQYPQRAAHIGIGPNYCVNHQVLQPGQQCIFEASWPGNTQGGLHTGAFDLRDNNGYGWPVVATVPVTTGVSSRSWFNVSDKGFSGYNDIIAHKDIVLTNVGNIAVDSTNVSLSAATGATGDGGFRIKYGPDTTCKTAGMIDPGETCTVRIEFCTSNDVSAVYSDHWSVRLTNGAESWPLSPVGTITATIASNGPDGTGCADYTGER